MTITIAIEGADGSGKATISQTLCDVLIQQGIRAEVISFPRYTETIAGKILGELLSSNIEYDAKLFATLYALDRYESKTYIEEKKNKNDVIIFDRHLYSNMVYQSAKSNDPLMMDWIYELETSKYETIEPQDQVYLNTPFEKSMELMLLKNKRSYTDKKFDKFESDFELQKKVREQYESLFQMRSWLIINTYENNVLRHKDDIANDILNKIFRKKYD